MVQMFIQDLKKVSVLRSVRFRVSALERFCYKGFLKNSSGTKLFVHLREVSALEDVRFRDVPLYKQLIEGEINQHLTASNTARKESKYGVFSGPYFPVFGLNTEIYGLNLRIQSKYRKIRNRKNSVFRHLSRSEVDFFF